MISCSLHLSPLRKFTLPDSDTSSEGVKSMNDIDFDIPTRHRLNELNVYRFNEVNNRFPLNN